MKLSIVITAYNVEKYILKCIDSVKNQTYKNIECIIVEDCSTDKTKEYIENILAKEKDLDIRVIWNNENIGAGMSRRMGIKASTGDYVMLLDADDFISSDYVELLINRQKETNADIVSGGITTIYENTDKYEIKTFGTICSDGIQKFKDYTNGKIVFLNNKIVRRSLYNQVEYCGRRYVEDTPVIMKLLYYANKVAYVNSAGYHYLQRDKSLCHTSSRWKHNLFCALCALELIEWFKDKEKPYNDLFKINQFIMYLKLMQREQVTKEELTKYIVEYDTCFNYLLKNIK